MNGRAIFSRKSDEYETPDDLFNRLNKEFDFNLDPCATDENRKCEKYFTMSQDGLLQSWGGCVSSAIHRTVKSQHGLRSAMRRA